jgi:hypothetical protein
MTVCILLRNRPSLRSLLLPSALVGCGLAVLYLRGQLIVAAIAGVVAATAVAVVSYAMVRSDIEIQLEFTLPAWPQRPAAARLLRWAAVLLPSDHRDVYVESLCGNLAAMSRKSGSSI